jgi:hypothetical protein
MPHISPRRKALLPSPAIPFSDEAPEAGPRLAALGCVEADGDMAEGGAIGGGVAKAESTQVNTAQVNTAQVNTAEAVAKPLQPITTAFPSVRYDVLFSMRISAFLRSDFRFLRIANNGRK